MRAMLTLAPERTLIKEDCFWNRIFDGLAVLNIEYLFALVFLKNQGVYCRFCKK